MKPVRYNLYSKVFYGSEYDMAKLAFLSPLLKHSGSSLVSRAEQIRTALKEATETHV